MRIGIDVRALKDNSGVTRYITNVLKMIENIDAENEYFLFSNRNIQYHISNSKWKIIKPLFFIPGTIWMLLILPFQIRKHHIDILWSPGQVCPILFADCKILLTIHDLVYKHFSKTMKKSVKLISQLLTPLSMWRADIIVTDAEFTKLEIESIYPKIAKNKKIEIVSIGKPDWVLPNSYNPLLREDYLLFVGNLEPRKNLINLILALEILAKEELFIPLHLVGPKGWENSGLFKKIKNSPIKSQVKVFGYLSDSQLIEQYLKCKVFIFPSLYEGFGIPILEALILDCLVLTSKGTVMEEIARNAALYCDPYNPNDIANQIKMIFCKDFCRDKFLNCREEILSKYSWKESVGKLQNLFMSMQKANS